MSFQPRALVLNAPGINCNVETAHAIDQAGGISEQVHINQLRSGERSLDDYQILALSGGFSHGDVVRSGAILGLELRKRFPEELNRFVEAGKTIIGICNGFQVLVESGLLPDGKIVDGKPKEAALVHNTNNTFECRWADMRVLSGVSKIIDIASLGPVITLPDAHGEGRYLMPANVSYADMIKNGQILASFIRNKDTSMYTEEYPHNPNGSPYGIMGVCDPSGRINGMMPHPERFVTTEQHPNWRRGEGQNPFGAVIFKNLIDSVRDI